MKAWKTLAQTFFFDSFRIEPGTGRIVCAYSTDAGHSFEYEYILDPTRPTNFTGLEPAAFALGMAALPSYWKATLAPRIVVKAGALGAEDIRFWETLYTKGLGEFFYVNQIDFRGLVHIESAPDAPVILATASRAEERALAAFGGGKDSLVTGEYLKRAQKPFTWFELRPRAFSAKLQEVSGVTDAVKIGGDAERNFGPVKKLVAEGAPNGHVPVTAMYLFGAVIAAKAYGYRDIVMSLERSASEGNTEYLGADINHQYSKSFEFEQMAAAYVARCVDPGLRVFSLLRPLYELQIVREFAKHPGYFPYFVSCNRGLATGTWCGECAKCAFMFLALSAFLPPPEPAGILKKNLFQDLALVPLFEELVGVRGPKPFECVGTFNENLLAAYLAGQRYESQNLPLPPVLEKLPLARGKEHLALLDERGPHQIPPDYPVP